MAAALRFFAYTARLADLQDLAILRVSDLLVETQLDGGGEPEEMGSVEALHRALAQQGGSFRQTRALVPSSIEEHERYCAFADICLPPLAVAATTRTFFVAYIDSEAVYAGVTYEGLTWVLIQKAGTPAYLIQGYSSGTLLDRIYHDRLQIAVLTPTETTPSVKRRGVPPAPPPDAVLVEDDPEPAEPREPAETGKKAKTKHR